MRIALVILWCMRWLPKTWVVAMANGLGSLLYHWGRRRVTLINLAKCFPDKSAAEREAIGRRVFQNLTRATLDLGRLWYAPREQVTDLVKLIDCHYADPYVNKVPVIILAPHFVGLDFGGAAFSYAYPQVFSMYSAQKSQVFDEALRTARARFGDPLLVTRSQGLRPVLKALKDNRPFYYLPDMDFGAKDAVFADFFGVKTATVTAMSRLCEITGAKVIPLITRQTATGYEAQFFPAWENYPSGDTLADARRMNRFLEDCIREMPEQYFWVHKRFKTRPEGEASFYE